MECILDKAQLKVYSHLILEKAIKKLQKLYKERNTQER